MHVVWIFSKVCHLFTSFSRFFDDLLSLRNQDLHLISCDCVDVLDRLHLSTCEFKNLLQASCRFLFECVVLECDLQGQTTTFVSILHLFFHGLKTFDELLGTGLFIFAQCGICFQNSLFNFSLHFININGINRNATATCWLF